jgi:hypothetical protein
MFRSRRPATDEAWEGTVVTKSRRNTDGFNLYHYVEVALADGTTRKVRVDRKLWKALADGDGIVKQAGSPPARRAR